MNGLSHQVDNISPKNVFGTRAECILYIVYWPMLKCGWHLNPLLSYKGKVHQNKWPGSSPCYPPQRFVVILLTNKETRTSRHNYSWQHISPWVLFCILYFHEQGLYNVLPFNSATCTVKHMHSVFLSTDVNCQIFEIIMLRHMKKSILIHDNGLSDQHANWAFWDFSCSPWIFKQWATWCIFFPARETVVTDVQTVTKCSCVSPVWPPLTPGCYGVDGESDSIMSSASENSTEPWFCDACKNGVSPSCELCPNQDGIFKETDAGRWDTVAH